MLAILCAAAVAWDLKSPLGAPAVRTYEMTVDVVDQGENHQAKFEYVLESFKTETGKPAQVKFSWNNIHVDGEDIGQSGSWKGSCTEAGLLEKVEEGDEFQRMLLPFVLPYPNKGVEKGDKWEAKMGTGADEIAYAATFVEVEKIGDVETAKVSAKMTPKNSDAVRSDGTFWIAADGRVLKFEVKAANWIVPMAGGNPMEAKLTGMLRK